MITYKEFEILKTIVGKTGLTDIPAYVIDNTYFELFADETEVERLVNALIQKGYIENGALTEAAKKELEPYRVNNAIILAAGGAAKSAKSIYSLPKGLYVKNGETLIERQIRQLQEAGIKDITVVLGYRQELYFFLAKKYGVKLSNTPAVEKGNAVTLGAVKDELSRTYICNCDNYFVENPFSQYEYKSFHATVMKEDCTREVQVKTNRNGRITRIFTAKDSGECLYGHSFVDEHFSKRLKEYLTSEIDVFRCDMMFWEEFAMRHVEDLDMYVHRYSSDFLYEFDSISETQSVETLFINDVSDKMITRICEVFNCSAEDIHDVVILDKGMTNILLTFMVKGQKYIFRYPGESSWELTSKKRECISQKLATRLGLDTSCIYIDEAGCKISKFREGLYDLSQDWATDEELVCKCAKMMRKLHDGTSLIDTNELGFDSISEGDRLMKLAAARKGDLTATFGELRENAVKLMNFYKQDDWDEVICHHDWKYDNILSNGECFDIIDWEYGAMDDPGADLLRILMGRDYDSDIFNHALDAYFGHKTTVAEKMHVIAAFVPMCYYWLGWLMYQESLGNNGFYWTILYYRTAEEAVEYTMDYYLNKK